jgi:hypothetical protein
MDPFTRRGIQMLGLRKAETLGHDADDRCGAGPQLDGATQHLRITIEARRPDLVADDDHRRLCWLFVVLHQRPTEHRCHPCHRERAGRDLGSSHGLDAPVLSGEVAHEDDGRAQVAYRLHLVTPHGEVVKRSRFRLELVAVPVQNRNDTRGIAKRQPRILELMDRLEVGRRERDRNSDRHRADDGEARVPHQHAEPDLEVEPRKSNPMRVHLVPILDALLRL